jgi:trimeric autotransporter adhesin
MRSTLARVIAVVSSVAAVGCDDPNRPDTSRDVASVVVTPDTRAFTAINDSARLSAEAKNPGGGTITGTTFVWSSLENNIASVDQTGMVKARAVGTARIVASASGKADTATITVTQTATRLTLAPEADTINAIGDVVVFTAVVTDANNVPLTNPTITWSTTTPTVVSAAGGSVTSLATGGGIVIATFGAVADTVTVLSRQIAATLSVAPSPATVMAGESQQLIPTAADSNGVAIPASAIGWASASPAIATVTATGLVRGESAGSTTVTATAPGGRTADVSINVQPDAPTGPLSWSIVHRGLVVGSNEPVGIMGSGPADVFMVGRSGAIYRYDGTRWSQVAGGVGSPATTELRSFWGTNSTSIWVVGTDTRPHPVTGSAIRSGRVYRVTGTTGSLHYTGQDFVTDFYDVSGTSDADIWVAGLQILHYDGAAWAPSLVPSNSTTTFTAIWAASQTSVFAGTQNGELWRYDGSNWAAESPSNGFGVTEIWGTSPTDVWAVDAGGFVRHWNGTAWQQSTRLNGGLSAVWGTSSTNVWVGGPGILARWDGGVWFVLDPATTAIGNLSKMWLSSATSGWFVTTNGGLSELRPDGWTKHWDSADFFFTDVAGFGSDVWVCGHPGAIQHLTAGSWRTERLPRSDACGSVTASSATNVLAGGGTAIYFRYNGASWTVQPTGATQRFEDLWTTSSGETYAVDRTSNVYRFDGSSWTVMPTGSAQGLLSVWASGPSDVFAAGELGTVMHYDGTSWTRLTTGTTGTLHSVWGASPTNVFFVGADANGGLALRYNGASFSSSNPASRALRGVHGRSPNEVYAVGDAGTIIRFNGSAWSSEVSGVDTELRDVWASPTGEVYVVGVPSLIVRGTR